MPPPKIIAAHTAQEFSSKAKEAILILQSLFSNGEGFKEYGILHTSEARLKSELESKNQTIEKMEKDAELAQEKIVKLVNDSQSLTQNFQVHTTTMSNDLEQKKSELEKLSEMKTKLKDCQNKLKHAEEENQKLTNEKKNSRNEFLELKDEADSQRIELELARHNEKQYEKQKSKLESELGTISFHTEKSKQQFENLALKFHRFAIKYFFKNIPNSVVNLEHFRSLPRLSSNTEPARLIRCAYVEAIISEELINNIFVDYYVPESIKSVIDAKLLTKMINHLREKHPGPSNIFSNQFAIICGQCDKTQPEIVNQATRHVLSIIGSWLSNEESRQASRDLKQLFQDSVSIWAPFQRARYHIWAQNDVYGNKIVGWPEYSNESLLPPGFHSPFHDHDPLIITFPQIYADKEIIFHARGLYRTEAVVVAAKQEESLSSKNNSNNGISRLRSSNHVQGVAQRPSGQRLSRPGSISSTTSNQTRIMKEKVGNITGVASSLSGNSDVAS